MPAYQKLRQRAREVCEISGCDGVDCVIDGGRREYGATSTIVDLWNPMFQKGVGMSGL
ncbi:MAG: hypothetical protein U9Q68_12045 [Euryarchaeota archaeon]|nr:hypothetical protein [Euryarchaeota archaeon]